MRRTGCRQKFTNTIIEKQYAQDIVEVIKLITNHTVTKVCLLRTLSQNDAPIAGGGALLLVAQVVLPPATVVVVD